MGFFGSLVGAVVKVATTPVAVAADVAKVATGQEPDTTKELVEDAVEDVADAMDDLCDGNL